MVTGGGVLGIPIMSTGRFPGFYSWFSRVSRRSTSHYIIYSLHNIINDSRRLPVLVESKPRSWRSSVTMLTQKACLGISGSRRESYDASSVISTYTSPVPRIFQELRCSDTS